jgi:hypothetical protein
MDEIISSLRERLSAFQQGEEIIGVPGELAREVKRAYWDGALKQGEYAEKLGLTVWELRKFLYKSRSQKPKRKAVRAPLVPVKVVRTKEIERSVSVVSPSGFRVELERMVDAAELLQLLEGAR